MISMKGLPNSVRTRLQGQMARRRTISCFLVVLPYTVREALCTRSKAMGAGWRLRTLKRTEGRVPPSQSVLDICIQSASTDRVRCRNALYE